MREKSGMDAAPCVSVAAGPVTEGACVIAGIAANATIATERRKSRFQYIGHLPHVETDYGRGDPDAGRRRQGAPHRPGFEIYPGVSRAQGGYPTRKHRPDCGR